jgi:hypothetical protein
MKSGSPDPISDLKLIIDTKLNMASRTCEVVSDATRWLKAQLHGCGVQYHYAACEEKEHYGHAVFIISRKHGTNRMALEMKVAEIQDVPYVFADVHVLGKMGGRQFPYFGEVGSEEGQERVLHYIADFFLSTEPDKSTPE